MAVKTLQMVFQTQGGGRLNLSLPDPKDNLTQEEVTAAMNTIIAKNIFTSSTGDATAILRAQVVSRETTSVLAQ